MNRVFTIIGLGLLAGLGTSCSSAPIDLAAANATCAKEIAVPRPPDKPVEPKLTTNCSFANGGPSNSGCDPKAKDAYDKAEADYLKAVEAYLRWDWNGYENAERDEMQCVMHIVGAGGEEAPLGSAANPVQVEVVP